jgi:hypothetical protein
MANSLNRDIVGKQAGGTPLPGTPKGEIIFSSGDLVHQGLREICKRRLERAPLSIGVLSEVHGGTPLLGAFKDG